MSESITTVPAGGVTSPRGFLAGAVAAGLRSHGSGDDLALLYSESACAAAGLFTDSAFKAAPVLLSQQHLADGRAQAVIANSGCANAYTGDDGYRDSEEMARLAASQLRLADSDVLVASTGVTGHRLPMDKIRAALPSLAVRADGGESFARAIMTTDTVVKQTAVAFHVGDREYRVGGCAKGAGMIHPNLATMLAFVTSDAAVEVDFLRRTLRQAADLSFDMISVDGDSSPNDTLLLLANGAAGGPTLREGDEGARSLRGGRRDQSASSWRRRWRATPRGRRSLSRWKSVGAASIADARVAARTVVGSPLVKSAVYGNDPNWGRVLAAVARSGAPRRRAHGEPLLAGRMRVPAGPSAPVR